MHPVTHAANAGRNSHNASAPRTAAPSAALLSNACCIVGAGLTVTAVTIVASGIASFGIIPIACTLLGLLFLAYGRHLHSKEEYLISRVMRNNQELRARYAIGNNWGEQFIPLQKFYRLSSKTPEFPGRYGLLRHHLAVTNNFRHCFISSPDQIIAFRQNTGIEPELMLTLLAVHDIGKGLGPRKAQHAYTKSVIKNMRDQINLDRRDAAVICELITQDPLGLVIKSRGQPAAMRAALIELNNGFIKIRKNRPQITRAQYFNIISIFYRCDAGSYPSLRKRLLTDQFEFLGNVRRLVEQLEIQFRSQPEQLQEGEFVGFTRVERCYCDPHLLRRDFRNWLSKARGNHCLGYAPVIIDPENQLPKYEKRVCDRFGIRIAREEQGGANVIAVVSQQPYRGKAAPENKFMKQKIWRLFF